MNKELKIEKLIIKQEESSNQHTMAFIGTIEFFTPGEDFDDYKERLQHLLTINKVTDDKMKVSYLITLIGPESYKILKSLTDPHKPDSKTFDELIAVFEKYFKPKVNIIAERFKFYKRNQKLHESISDYIVELKTLAQSCDFKTFLEEALRDKLVCGINNESIQQKLLNETGLTFDKACELAKNMEMTKSQLQQMRPESFNSIQQGKNCYGRQRERSQSRGRLNFNKNANSTENKSNINLKNVICFRCGKAGHYKINCRVNLKYNNNFKGKNINYCDESDEQLNNLSVGYINTVSSISSKAEKVMLNLNNKNIEMEIDSGACSSVISYDFYKNNFNNIKMGSVEKQLNVVTGHEVEIIGKIIVTVKDVFCATKVFELELIVINSVRKFIPLLGRDWLDVLFPLWRSNFSVNKINENLDKKIDDLKVQFPKVFSNDLKDPIIGYDVQLKLKKDAVPHFSKPYTVPFGIRDKVNVEIDRLVEQNILVPVKYSDWAAPMVVVPKKNGDLRLCLNCKVAINKSIESQVYPLPRMDDLFTKIANCKVFCILDLSGAYLQLAVKESSQQLLTVNTQKGLFKFTRLPFGVSVAPAEFQKVMDEILKAVDKVGCYLDDVLVGGQDLEECENNLIKVLEKLENHNIRINFGKCRWFQKEVQYLGHVISGAGIKPNQEKIRAILEAPSPKNVTQLKSFFGLLNFYNRFVPNLASELRILYNLLKKNNKFQWNVQEEKAFEKAKMLISNKNILEHYDPKKPIVITCDASPYGVGAVLSHMVNGEEKPVMFASSTLSVAEQNYSQTHREALAIIYAVKKFHKYIYGHKFIIYTDHQPLREIFNEKKGHLSVAAARMQRWAVHLSMYNYEIKYKSATKVGHADALSRLPIENSTEIPEEFLNFLSFGTGKIKLLKLKDISTETMKDRLLSKVYKGLMNFECKNSADIETKYYYDRITEFTCNDGCIYYGNRVVIPDSLKFNILKILHDTHIGIVRMKMLARSYVWWRKLDSDIEQFVRGCRICAQTQNFRKVVKESSWNTTSHTYERVHIDFFSIEGLHFLLLVDSYSKWIEVSEMKTTSATKVIDKLRNWFSVFGIPMQLVSDNGPPFQSGEFIEFCTANGIKVLKSPPYHPQSNGQCENSVRTVKRAFIKFLMETNSVKKDLNFKIDNFLLKYRNTPSTVTGKSPADFVFQFKPKTLLEIMVNKNKSHDIQSNPKTDENVPNKISILKNCKARFENNENIYYKNHFKTHVKWLPGFIMHKITNYLYKVKVNGVIRVAHVNQLKKCYKSVKFNTFAKCLRINNNDNENDLEVDSNSEDVFYSPVPSEEENIQTSSSDENSDKIIDTNIRRNYKKKNYEGPVRKSERIKSIRK